MVNVTVTILSDEEIEVMYPKEDSQMAERVYCAVNSGFNIVSIKCNLFDEDIQNNIKFCKLILKERNFILRYVIDRSKLENKEIILACELNH